MSDTGIKPATLRSIARRSNQLTYAVAFNQVMLTVLVYDEV